MDVRNLAVDNICTSFIQGINRSVNTFVLPGIGDELNTTVSSGIILICLCVPLAILDNAAIGSP